MTRTCPRCGGDGWTLEIDHAPLCWATGHCEDHGCPVQIQVLCDGCDGAGRVPEGDSRDSQT